MERLDEIYPETPVPLNHKSKFELLIAVLLSAQCTDERVNQVTPQLFSLADNPLAMSKLQTEKIYEIISKIENFFVEKNIEIYYPIKEMMGDNAAMIAWACMKFYKKDRNDLFFKPIPRLEVRSIL